MRYRLGIAVIVVGLLPVVQALGQEQARRADAELVEAYKLARTSYDRARKLFEKRDLENATKELESCLRRLPEFSDAHFLLAKIDYLEKRYPESLDRMERAEKTFEASSALFLDLQGDRFDELKRRFDQLDAQLRDLQEALARATSIEQQNSIRGRMVQVQQDKDTIQRQLYAPPTEVAGMPADYYFFHGNILLRLNRLDDAAAQYREALKVKPDHADASNNLASLYLSAGHPQVAMDILDQAEAQGATVNADLRKAVAEALQR
jgi:tetratricopeptide (TPR) repeat protein